MLSPLKVGAKHRLENDLAKHSLKAHLSNRLTKEKTTERQTMPIYRCSCGQKILIVPDISAMNKAIQNHLNEHFKATNQVLTEETLTQEMIKIMCNI